MDMMAARSAFARSIFVTNTKHGTLYRRNSAHSVSVCACTPSVPLTTSTAQSSTESVRSVSAEKST